MPEATSHYFGVYESEFLSSYGDICKKLAQTSTTTAASADARRNYISQLEAAIKDCGATLTQLEREAYSVSKTQQKPLFEKIKAYKKDFEDRKREYKLFCVNSINSGTSNGAANSLSIGKSSEYASLIPSTQNNSCEILSSTYTEALKTEQLGASIMLDLRRQREQLENSERNMEALDGSLNKSSKLLRVLYRALIMNRYMSYLFFLILVAIIVGLIYWKNSK